MRGFRKLRTWWFVFGAVFVTIMLAGPAFCAGSPPIPINVAEAIIERFWSTETSGLDKWTIDTGDAHGLQLNQSWSAVNYEWASKPATGPALRMTRGFDVDCSEYDRLLVKLAPPRETVVRVG